MNEWAKEFLANTSDIDWTELDDDTSFLSSSPQNSSGIPAGKAEAIGSSSSTANTGDERTTQQPHKGKRRNHQKYRQRHQQQHRHNPCSDVNNDLPAIATAEHSGKEAPRESLRSRSPLRPARNRLFDGAVQSIVRDQQKRPSANDQSPTPTVAVSKPAYNHRQEADNLRQTIVSFQAPTMRRLDEVIDIIHQHCGVTQEFIMWRRLVPAFDKRLPIVVVRYCQKELAKLIRYACSEFIKQTECRDFDYGPVDAQLTPKVDISELGRKVFRSERGLDDLYEREGIPGFISLWLFIWEFSEPKLGRKLEFYFEEWLRDVNVCKRNEPFLQCDDGLPVLRRWDFECGVKAMPFQANRHQFQAPAEFNGKIIRSLPSFDQLTAKAATDLMETVVVIEFHPASLPAISSALSDALDGAEVFDHRQPFDAYRLMLDESVIETSTLGPELLNSSTDSIGKSIKWFRYVHRSPDTLLAVMRLTGKQTAEMVRSALCKTTASYVGPMPKDLKPLPQADSDKAWPDKVVAAMDGSISLDCLWQSANYRGVILMILRQLHFQSSGGRGDDDDDVMNDLYNRLLTNTRFGVDGRRQAITYLSLISPGDFNLKTK